MRRNGLAHYSPEGKRIIARTITTQYTPNLQSLVAYKPERCYFGTAPAIGRVTAALGAEFATTWIMEQINHFSLTLKAADQLTEADIEQVAMLIISNYPQLNLAEIMLFFSRLAGGIYGQVAFGQVRAENITTKIPLFLKHRATEIERYERQRQHELLESEADRQARYAVNRTEYERIKAEALEMFDGDEQAAEAYIIEQSQRPDNITQF